MTAQTYLGDCLEITQQLSAASVDLIYLDPPFFTQSVQKLGTRDREREFSFDDRWNSMKEYAEYLFVRLQEFRRVLAATGSIFFHCDQNASHLARFLLDEVFGREMFRAEIIWHYRRWSNSQRNLLPAHQTIYYYSKTSNYKFNELMQEYSPSTNVDQILQKRARDEFNKSVYARDDRGAVITNGYKKGVPLNDVWDIPFLNPKAKERTGYPTQKPILLLERIIHLATDEKDLVLDPFCGSGTTLVAAALCGRSSMGIDISPAAIEIAQMRLKNPAKTDSHLLKAGRDAYRTADQEALSHLKDLAIVPVQRNSGIDALLQEEINGGPVPIRVQRAGETLLEAAYALHKAAKTKNASIMLLVATDIGLGFDLSYALPVEVVVVDSTANAITRCINDLKANRADGKQRTLQIAAIKSKGVTL